VDPLAGSYFVESLTDSVQAKAEEYLARIAELGGAARAIEYMQQEVHRAAYEHQLAVESGETVVVGVNAFRDAAGEPVELRQPDFAALAREQLARLARVKEARDGVAVASSLDDLRAAAR